MSIITGPLSDVQPLLNSKENTITAGTTAQYYRGDKTFQTLNKAAVGLGNVDNTSDLNKPISTATQAALDLKAGAVFGDVKNGFQAADHNGWIKLDGRLISTLTSGQQTQATALGFATNLPDASNSFAVQNGLTLGNVSGSNSKTIARANLPNVTLSGTTSDNTHNHSSGVSGSGDTRYGNVSGPSKSVASTNTNSSGYAITSDNTHNHTLTTESINGGVTQTALDITPKSISVNMFVYLGS